MGTFIIALGKPSPNELPLANYNEAPTSSEIDVDNGTVIEFPDFPNMTWAEEENLRSLIDAYDGGSDDDGVISDNSTGAIEIKIKVPPGFNSTTDASNDNADDRIINPRGAAGRGWFPIMAEVYVFGSVLNMG